MNRLPLIAAVAALSALTACRDAPPPPPPYAPPRILSFTADKQVVNPGTSVKLSYSVEGATELELLDDTGANVELKGDVLAGEAVVAPQKTHFYVLRVSGRGGRESAFVQVAVGQPLSEAFLIAVPPVINGGENVELLWGAPRSKSVTLTASTGETRQLFGDSGAEVFTPARTTTYTLVADPGTGAAALSAAVQVDVKPVLDAFTVSPGAAQPGATLQLRWKAAGATRVILNEATFGTLVDSTDPDVVDDGPWDFEVPTTLPNGAPVEDRLPLHFTLKAFGSSADVVVSRDVDAYVGTGPVISEFEGPEFVTEKTGELTFRWKTAGAESVSISTSGATLFETLPGHPLRVSAGSFTAPAPVVDTAYTLTARDALGVTTAKTLTVKAVKAPKILTFEGPLSVSTVGASTVLSWTTENATTLVIRGGSGANFYATNAVTEAESGSLNVGIAQETTFTLLAFNAAGDFASKPLTILAPSGNHFSTDAGISVADVPIFVNYDFNSLAVAQVFGLPDSLPQVSQGTTSFVDLATRPDAVELSFSSTQDAVATVSPGHGFVFPFFGKTYETFFVSIDGQLALTPIPASNADNVNFPAAALGQVLCPFWDQLQLGATGKVRWWFDDVSFPRRLVVSWSNLNRGIGTDLSFQVQLFEDGTFKFVYGTLYGPLTAGENATIGVHAKQNSWFSQLPGSNVGGAAVTSMSELLWFANSNAGTFMASFPTYTRLPIYTLGSNGRRMLVEGTVRVFGPELLSVSEAMPSPEPLFASTAQWVELRNHGAQPLDVGGLVLSSGASTNGGYTLPYVSIPANGTLLLGQDLNLANTDNAPVQHVYSDVPLRSTGGESVSLYAGNGTVTSLAWSSSSPMQSIIAPQQYAYFGDGGTTGVVPVTCPTANPYNVALSAYGSPGAVNPPCLGYSVEKIPGDYEDITGTGTPIFSSLVDDEQFTTLELGPNGISPAVKYYGQSYSRLWVSMNGWIGWTTQFLGAPTERTLPAAGLAPQGLLAAFWDDLDYERGRSNVYWRRAPAKNGRPAYLVIAWHDAQHDGIAGDVIHAEAKLFDDGVIELHYGTLQSGSSANYASGASATVWLEEPKQPRALAIGRDQAVLTPNTGYRFTPAP